MSRQEQVGAGRSSLQQVADSLAISSRENRKEHRRYRNCQDRTGIYIKNQAEAGRNREGEKAEGISRGGDIRSTIRHRKEQK
jgi:hypothetical protein